MDGNPPGSLPITVAEVMAIEERAAQATAYTAHAQQVCARLRQQTDKLLRNTARPADGDQAMRPVAGVPLVGSTSCGPHSSSS